jgi:hypothetical protein
MSDNKFISWTAFVLFTLTVVTLLLSVCTPLLERITFLNPEALLWVMGGFFLLSTVLGFISFKTPQGKIAAIGGAVLFLMLLIVTPANVTFSP